MDGEEEGSERERGEVRAGEMRGLSGKVLQINGKNLGIYQSIKF